MMRFTYIVLCVLLFSTAVVGHAQVTRDTFEVYFPLNDAKLTKQASDFIDQMIFRDILIHGQKLVVLGYADYVGDNAYNDALSAKRANAVLDYLVNMGGFNKSDVRLCLGKGKVSRVPANGNKGNNEDRKVEIIIDREAMKMPAPIVEKPKKEVVPVQAPKKELPKPPPPKKDTVPAMPVEAIPVEQVRVNATFALNILFENNQAIVLAKSYPVVDQLLEFMKANPTVNIQVEGHICCRYAREGASKESLDDGMATSWARAKTIYDFLLNNGISASRLRYIGVGSNDPLVYPELKEEDRERNRRVVIRIMSK